MKKLLAALLLALALALPAFAASSPAGFTRAFAKALEEAAPGVKVTIVKDLELRVTTAAKHDQDVFLNNAYQLYQESPQEGHDVLARYVAGAVETLRMESHELQTNRIVPVIKDRAWLEEVRAAAKAKGKDGEPAKIGQVWEDYNEDLVVVYAEDTPANVRYFSADDLAKAGLKLSELRPLAIKNLHALVPEVRVEGANDVYMLIADGAYEASHLLATAFWTEAGKKVPGEVVVAIPSRDMLLFTGSKSQKGLATVKKIAAEIVAKAPYALTPRLFVFRDGKFVRFKE